MKLVFIACLAAVLSGCGTLGAGESPLSHAHAALRGIVAADLDAAKAIAEAGGDTVAANCYAVLKADLAERGTTTVAVKGAVSLFEKARLLRRKVTAGVSEDIHVACAPVVLDAEATIIKIGVLFGRGGLPLPLAPVP